MTRTESVVVTLVLAGAAGCSAGVSPPSPRPLAVVPAVGFAATGGPIQITGEDFEVKAVHSVSETASQIDVQYRAWLGSTELLDVVWVDARTLRARVPPGLPVAHHDLTVEGPFGRGVLAGAYEVLPGSPSTVEVVATDPFADGSPFAFVAGYRGQVYVGPNRTGTGLVRMQPDGSAPRSLSFAFAQDRTGNSSTNTTPVPGSSPPTYASIGFTGCTPNGVVNACGPDDEDGRGLFTSVTFAGSEWLLLGGARSAGELDYVYMSMGDTSPLAFSYVDIGSVLGGATRGFSAAHAVGDRLYLGFPDDGGSRPYGVALVTAPSSPGLDAVANVDAFDVGLHDAYNQYYPGGFTAISMVDAIADLGGVLYFFDNAGCLGTTAPIPASKDDWFPCSPTDGLDYDVAGAVDPARQYDLEPRDRAWPQVAVWQGRLFAIRNTTSGPQLWCCDPARRSDPTVCDPSDWYLVAADASFRTRFGRPSVSAASLLVATPTHLFVGFDDPVAGIHVFRTALPAPATAADFTGRDGCIAGDAGCEGIGGDGIGAPATLTRIFDAKAIPTGPARTDLYLTAGNGVDPVRLVRISP